MQEGIAAASHPGSESGGTGASGLMVGFKTGVLGDLVVQIVGILRVARTRVGSVLEGKGRAGATPVALGCRIHILNLLFRGELVGCMYGHC
jgi:hypothetical protein